MAETANGKAFSVLQAAKALEGLSDFERGLVQRTEGATWAVWGLLTAAIFVSYGLAGVVFGPGAWPIWAQNLWAPWVAAGIAFTFAMWRSAALAAPRTAEGPSGWLYVGAWFGFMLAVWLLVWMLRPEVKPPILMTLVLGSASILLGGVLLPCTRPAKRMALGAGALMLLAGLALVAVDADYPLVMAVGPLATGGSWFLGGLWLLLRG